MKNHIILLAAFVWTFILTFNSNIYAQKNKATQIGKVYDTERNGKALPGVGITVSQKYDDYQPARSDSHGEFQLEFSEHIIGDKILGLRAEKKDYEIVNIHLQFEGFIITNSDTLRIIMAPTTIIKEARAKYYDLCEAAHVEQYKATINYLNEQLAQEQLSDYEYQYWKNLAENELEKAYANLYDQADQLARYSLEYGTEPSLASMTDINSPSVLDELQGTMTITPSVFKEEYKASFDTFEALPYYGTQYADACYGLAQLYETRNQPDEATKYLLQALRMFETLQSLGHNYTLEIQNIKAKLNK